MNTIFVILNGTLNPILLNRTPRAPDLENLTERWFEGDVRAGAELARLGERPRVRNSRPPVLEYQI